MTNNGEWTGKGEYTDTWMKNTITDGGSTKSVWDWKVFLEHLAVLTNENILTRNILGKEIANMASDGEYTDEDAASGIPAPLLGRQPMLHWSKNYFQKYIWKFREICTFKEIDKYILMKMLHLVFLHLPSSSSSSSFCCIEAEKIFF